MILDYQRCVLTQQELGEAQKCLRKICAELARTRSRCLEFPNSHLFLVTVNDASQC